MHYKRIVWILVGVLAVSLALNKTYYSLHPNQVSIDATKLSVIEEETGELELIDRNTERGKRLLNKLYGSYSAVLHTKLELPVSTPSPAEFTVPQIEDNNKAYVVREHPNLRYELWKEEAPDVVLLGSSIFFCDFNREVFFEHHPNKKLLDFTTGNNTPYIAHYFMQRANSMHLTFKPGSIVLYGMNRVEMLQEYKSRDAHNFVIEALNGEGEETNPDEQIAAFLKIPELRYDLTNGLKHTYDDIFRGNNVYRKRVEDKHIVNDETFIVYQKSVAPAYSGSKKIEEDRITEIQALATLLKKHGCQLVILKLPQSLYNDIAMNTEGYSYFDSAMAQLEPNNIRYVDASAFKEYNIKQTDYLWPGNIFDPEHLNVQGAKRYTEALIKNIVDSLLTKEHIKN